MVDRARPWLVAIGIAMVVEVAAFVAALNFSWGGLPGSRYAITQTLYLGGGPALALAAGWLLAWHRAARPLGFVGSMVVLASAYYGCVFLVTLAAKPLLDAQIPPGSPGDAGSLNIVAAGMLGMVVALVATPVLALLLRRRLRLAAAVPGVVAGVILVVVGFFAFDAIWNGLFTTQIGAVSG